MSEGRRSPLRVSSCGMRDARCEIRDARCGGRVKPGEPGLRWVLQWRGGGGGRGSITLTITRVDCSTITGGGPIDIRNHKRNRRS